MLLQSEATDCPSPALWRLPFPLMSDAWMESAHVGSSQLGEFSWGGQARGVDAVSPSSRTFGTGAAPLHTPNSPLS